MNLHRPHLPKKPEDRRRMFATVWYASVTALALFGVGFATAGVWYIAGRGWAFLSLGVLLIGAGLFCLLGDVVPDREGQS